ncbi:TPA: hypothetical protein ACTZ5W_005767 [Bacillus cereus]
MKHTKTSCYYQYVHFHSRRKLYNTKATRESMIRLLDTTRDEYLKA